MGSEDSAFSNDKQFSFVPGSGVIFIEIFGATTSQDAIKCMKSIQKILYVFISKIVGNILFEKQTKIGIKERILYDICVLQTFYGFVCRFTNWCLRMSN